MFISFIPPVWIMQISLSLLLFVGIQRKLDFCYLQHCQPWSSNCYCCRYSWNTFQCHYKLVSSYFFDRPYVNNPNVLCHWHEVGWGDENEHKDGDSISDCNKLEELDNSFVATFMYKLSFNNGLTAVYNDKHSLYIKGGQLNPIVFPGPLKGWQSQWWRLEKGNPSLIKWTTHVDDWTLHTIQVLRRSL